MPFIFLFLFSFAWSEIGTCGEPCRGSVVYGGDVSYGGGLCFTEGAVFTRYDNLVSSCHASGYEANYCICIAASYCTGYYMIRGSCSELSFSSSSVFVPPVSSSSSASPPPPVSSASPPPPDYSSGSEECSSNDNDFNFDNVMRGFADYNYFFFMVFACFCLVKLVNMIK